MSLSSMMYDVALVGAGICGLASAVLLKKLGFRVCVLETRPEAGGRIRSVRDSQDHVHLGDLGPTWVWPRQQPVLNGWLDKLGISVFSQYIEGDSLVDLDIHSTPQRQRVPVQADAYRIDSGSAALVSALADSLSSEEIHKSFTVSLIDASATKVRLHKANSSDYVEARHAIVCTPPRIALKHIQYSPELPSELVELLDQTPTWMAEHAKIVILYKSNFWRKKGLSGRVISHVGPIAELQDHCGPGGQPAALTGFLGWSARKREAKADQLSTEIRQQLIRVFGADAPAPLNVIVKDWAQDAFTCVNTDHDASHAARRTMANIVRQPYGRSNIWFAGSETSSISPGLIEGAFASAEEVVERVVDVLRSR